jgi:hypothetical protein
MGSEMQPGVMRAQKRKIQMIQPDKICKFDPKSKKKLSEYQINQSERKFSQKKYI